jgi:NCS1 family nucleobase:cation symporter-1
MSAATTTGRVVEAHSIEPIPDAERHGRPWNLFTLWFASNITVVAVITGAVAVSLGLSLTWSIIAMVAGNLIGGVFMAYHSVQGPRMGLPQMIQSRAQFGSAGAVLPMIVTVLMYLGFQIEGNISFGAAMAAQTGLSVNGALVLFGFIGIVTALFGYRVIHGLSKIMTVVTGLIFAAFLVKLISAAGSAHIPATHSTFANILLAVSISVSWQITWAPYVSDYSRYLPSRTSLRATFWYTYGGSVVSAIIFATLGVLAGSVALNDIESNTVGYLAGLLPGAIWLVTIVLLLSIVAGNAINLYSPLLTGVAIASKDGGAAPGAWVRGIGTGVIMAITGYLATVVSANFVTDVSDFISFLLYIVIPWSAINLVDYYLVRRGDYDIGAIFTPDGPYGRVNWRTIGVFLVGIAVEIPFMNASYPKFEGPAASALSGADISWLVGFVIAGVLYYIVTPANGSTGRNRRRVALGPDAGAPGHAQD